MGRIFVGLCQVGAWGCFDEFNRLEERMLSAVSQQIQAIQEALKENAKRDKSGQSYVHNSFNHKLIMFFCPHDHPFLDVFNFDLF
jgi:hypothetical protein